MNAPKNDSPRKGKEEMLRNRREELAGSLAETVRALRPSGEPGDEADVASEATANDVALEVVRVRQCELKQIERCKEITGKVREGCCECCRKKIPPARLNARPHATRCVTCQRDEEQCSGGTGGNKGSSGWDKVYETERETGKDDRLDVHQAERLVTR